MRPVDMGFADDAEVGERLPIQVPGKASAVVRRRVLDDGDVGRGPAQQQYAGERCDEPGKADRTVGEAGGDHGGPAATAEVERLE